TRVEILETQTKELEDKTIHLSLEQEKERDQRAIADLKARERCLKIRGLKELQNEDLYQYLIPILADFAEIPCSELLKEVDKTFRINSKTARERNLPRDISIYFIRTRTKELILEKSYQKRLVVDKEELMILKDIPARILKRRAEYRLLTSSLKRHNIPYRWEVPEGVSFTYKKKRLRINSQGKARDFLRTLKKGSPPEETSESNQNLDQLEEEERRSDQEEERSEEEGEEREEGTTLD
ncbi:uncharacterized protein LOC121917782, partial [Sceloporus undulatus]|uniref:uncharacterized protein LOC121917782 n=1 Tax=Sceloporus undulatus TaxID=8520 RepID=UPI001C4C8A1F